MNGVVYDNTGKPIYTLWAERYEPLDHYIFKSCLPQELLWYTSRDILSIKSNLSSIQSIEQVRNMVIKRLQKTPVTKYFFLPDHLISDKELITDLFESYMQLLSAQISLEDKVYSENNNDILFSVLRYRFNRAQFLSYDTFETNLIQISRRQFERSFGSDQRAIAEYIRNYCAHNLFYRFIDKDRSLCFMTTGFELHLVTVLLH